MIKKLQILSGLMLFAMLFFVWGCATAQLHVFPYKYLLSIVLFFTGNDLGFLEQIQNDLGFAPTRLLREFKDSAAEKTKPIKIANLKGRREMPLIYLDPEFDQGYHAVFGAMDFEESLWGGVLINPTGEAVHEWKLSTDHLPLNKFPEERKLLYGLHLEPDGSVIFHHQEKGGGLVKVDASSEVVWQLDGEYHHCVTASENNSLWTFTGSQKDFQQDLVEVSDESGEILRRIKMAEVRQANADKSIFRLGHRKQESALEDSDVLHGNDIEPLPAALADSFPGFEVGDLLISYRNVNLVFVLDPETLDIKWWRIGPWARQHDSDWEPDGRIVAFSNNAESRREFSQIVAVQPETYETEVVLEGADFDFYSKVNGRHQLTTRDTRVIASSTQGWAFEVDKEQRVVFSFLNNYLREQNQSLHVAEIYHLDSDYFTPEFLAKITQKETGK